MSKSCGKRAVVVGAGIGGLAAAAAISEFFDEVTVLERDELAPGVSPRKGTPQSYQPHVLLVGGQRALGELFPNFDQHLVRAGAVPYRVGLHVREERPGYDPFPQRDLGLIGHTMSRPLIEREARERLKQLANVVLLDRCRAIKLMAADDGSVAAIEYEDAEGMYKLLESDLVIDASGRGLLTLSLLEETRHPQPEQTSIGVDIGYATGVFAASKFPEWKLTIVLPESYTTGKTGFLFRIEEDRWMALVGERHAPLAPDDINGFMAQVRELRTSTISDALKHATPLGKIRRFAFRESSWRHYERLDAFPRGLLPIGDAICRFTPVYGQGMAVAAMEACVLKQLLRTASDTESPLDGLALAFFAGVLPLIERAWSMSAIPDFAHPETRGERPADLQETLHFNAALVRAAADDADIHARMMRVRHLIDPPSVLREPAIVRRIQMEMAEAR